MYRFSIILLLMLAVYDASGQRQDSLWFGTGALRALLSVDQPIIKQMVAHTSLGEQVVMNECRLWAGGMDPAGNLLILADRFGDTTSQGDVLKFGFYGIPNSAGIWKVTQKEIQDHEADYKDNRKIDNPIPSIFSWPSFSNPNSLKYNGFELTDPSLKYSTAPCQIFFDIENSPDCTGRSVPWGSTYAPPPCEQVYIPFYLDRQLSTTRPTKIKQGYIMLWNYNCCTPYFHQDAIHMQIVLSHVTDDFDLMDSTYIGLFIDGQMGIAGEERVAGSRDFAAATFYHKDFASDPEAPFFTVELDEFEHTKNNSMIMYEGGSFPSPTKRPTSEAEKYNILTNHFLDNTPLSDFETGYNPGSPYKTVSRFFPGDIIADSSWTDLKNPDADRFALITRGPRQYPLSLEEEFDVIFYLGHRDHTAQNYQSAIEQYKWDQGQISHYGILNPGQYHSFWDQSLCTYRDDTNQAPVVIDQLYPNPLTGLTFYVLMSGESFGRTNQIEIYAIDGKTVYSNTITSNAKLRVDLNQKLPTGMYTVRIKNEIGNKTFKLIVE